MTVIKGIDRVETFIEPFQVNAMSVSSKDYRFSGHRTGTSAAALPNRPPSLGRVLLILNHLAWKLLSARTAANDMSQKLQFIDQLSSQEMSAYLMPAAGADKLGSSDRQKMAAQKMREEIAGHENEVLLAGCGVEAAAFLVWRHLEHFLLFSSSSSAADGSVFDAAYRRKAGGKYTETAEFTCPFFISSMPLTDPPTFPC